MTSFWKESGADECIFSDEDSPAVLGSCDLHQLSLLWGLGWFFDWVLVLGVFLSLSFPLNVSTSRY